MQLQPAAGNRQIEAGLVFGRRGFLREQERPVDLLDLDAAVMDDLDGVGNLQQLAGGHFRIRVLSQRSRPEPRHACDSIILQESVPSGSEPLPAIF